MISSPKKLQRVHGGNTERHKRYLDFSVNTNPLGFPRSIRTAILHSIGDIGAYPDPDARNLRQAIAAYHHIPMEMILPVNGSAELIHLLMHFRPLSKVLVVTPAFTEYAWAAARGRAKVISIATQEANRFHFDLERVDWPRLLKGVDRVFLCNPNNPTGAASLREDVAKLAEHCLEAGALLIVDEAFVEFARDRNQISVMGLIDQWNHVVVMNSLTKFFAIPGLRLGYAAAAKSLIDDLRAIQPAWPLNTFALAVGESLFSDRDYWAYSRQEIIRLREQFEKQLSEIPGIHAFPSVTNFILCKLERSDMTSSELCRQLAERGLWIRNCDDFSGLAFGRFIRLAVKQVDENKKLIEALHEVFKNAG